MMAVRRQISGPALPPPLMARPNYLLSSLPVRAPAQCLRCGRVLGPVAETSAGHGVRVEDCFAAAVSATAAATPCWHAACCWQVGSDYPPGLRLASAPSSLPLSLSGFASTSISSPGG
ncbi:unnamed protein product [Schistocephalus solidus]|uniref:Uncharacterized protein n=1 Tax=Schistocephalus solidus TaxID=70667 RepID=A0A183TA99_SCHSO|nr:unnamed protein product [Schistocephalus solidus]